MANSDLNVEADTQAFVFGTAPMEEQKAKVENAFLKQCN